MEMKKRATRKSVLPMEETPTALKESPTSVVLDKSRSLFGNDIGRKEKRTSDPAPVRSPPSKTTVTSVSDLKDLLSSRLDDIKRNLIDRSHVEILKDVEASNSRLQKRLKIQMKASQQVMDEAEKEYKKIYGQISETQDAMKVSYAEFMAEAQASTSRVCKVSLSELSRSFEKEIDGLRSRFGNSSS